LPAEGLLPGVADDKHRLPVTNPDLGLGLGRMSNTKQAGCVPALPLMRVLRRSTKGEALLGAILCVYCTRPRKLQTENATKILIQDSQLYN